MIVKVVKLAFTYFLLLALFLSALVAVCFIPSSMIRNSIGESISELKKEGIYPLAGVPGRQIGLDNFTDTLMLNIAYSVNSSSPFEAALRNVRFDNREDSANQIKSLEYVHRGRSVIAVNYERYWHGYLVYLRPLLTAFSYQEIRWIVSVILYGGGIMLIYLTWKKINTRTALALFLGLVATDFFFIGKSLQFSSVYFIGIGSSIYILLRKKALGDTDIFFFVVGAFASFFDLLTAPLVSLGLPLITFFGLTKKKSLFMVIRICLFWSMGYGTIWFSKWYLFELLFGQGVLQGALEQVRYRMTGQVDAEFSVIETIKRNMYQLRGYDRRNKFVLLFSFIGFAALWLKYFRFHKDKLPQAIPWLFVAAVPYAWYAVAANHSYFHVWYTYRAQYMTVASLCMVVALFIDIKRLVSDVRTIFDRLMVFFKPAPKTHKG